MYFFKGQKPKNCMKFYLPLFFLGLIDKKAIFFVHITKLLILTPIKNAT